MPRILYIRMFAEEPSEEFARCNVAERIEVLIRPYAKNIECRIKRYWKIPEHFEVFMEMSVVGEISNIFDQITSTLGTGWEELQPLESIWNPSPPTSIFTIESVRWAHIEVLPNDFVDTHFL